MRFGLVLSSALLALTAGVNAQSPLLYDNGPIITHPGQGGGGLDASALDNTATFHPPHNVYGFGAQWAAGAGNSLADNFTVCGTWTITDVEVFGYLTNGIPPLVTGVYCQIWDHDPSVAGNPPIRGDLTTNLLTTPPGGVFNCYRTLIGGLTVTNRQVLTTKVPVTWAPLPAGTYWFEFQFTGAAFCPPVTINERNVTGDAKQRQGAATWVVLNNAIAPNVAGVAIPIRFYGTGGGFSASASAYGAGKPGTNGIGQWNLGTPVANPVLGRDYQLQLVNGFTGSSPVVLIGTALGGGLPIPGIGTLYVLPILTTISLPAFDAANKSTQLVAVPHGSSLCGVALAWQGVWGDPGAAGGIGHSDGLNLVLGN